MLVGFEGRLGQARICSHRLSPLRQGLATMRQVRTSPAPAIQPISGVLPKNIGVGIALAILQWQSKTHRKP
jgi:hypothetical protein